MNIEKKISINVDIPDCDINQNIALERLRIDPLSEIPEPPVFCRIGSSPSMTAGNFSLLIGKAKSGKTFFLGSLVGSLLNNSIQLNVIIGNLPESKRFVLYFDTEQSAFHASRTIKRICTLVGINSPDNLLAYGLRPLTPSERLSYIEEKISQTENIGLVVIDGVRDLLTKGINDEEEATSLTSKFLKLTSDYAIHIILLLHENKNDGNARGHIGTELVNKAETTISVTKDKKNDVFIVTCLYSRDIAHDDFAFTIKDGLPISSDLPKGVQTKGKSPQLISDQEHLKVLEAIYKENGKLNRQMLSDKIKHEFGHIFGNNKCREFIDLYLERKWIERQRLSINVFYVYKRALL